MPVQVRQPKKDDTMQKLLTIGGLAAGGAAGGFSGAATGSSLGSTAGNLLSSRGGDAQPVQSNAMARRLNAAPQVEDPIKALEDARMALATQPQEVRAEYEPAIKAALVKARRGQGVA